MIVFPCAKINLGLNIVGLMPNGYHAIETVFHPIPLCDALEIKYMDERFPSDTGCDLKVTGNNVDCDEAQNLVVRAYELLAADFKLPRVHAHLFKRIPSQAGLGGGSSDGAYMIRLLDERFRLNMGYAEMERYAARLGADCAFFITSEPSFATGVGDQLEPADNANGYLRGYWVGVVKPDIAVSTRDAYQLIEPKHPDKCCREVVRQPVETWKDNLHNDFETPVFNLYPELRAIKERLYALGALYAQMSGSGSAIYGLFRDDVAEDFHAAFPGTFRWFMKI